MGAGILQLVATGIQDKVLTEDAQITFFKSVYRRHTPFSVESICQSFTTHADFGKTVTCIIGRLGDLINKTFLYVHLPEPLDNAFRLIDWVELHVGNQILDRQTGEYIQLTNQMSSHDLDTLNKMTNQNTVYIPLTFWFNKASSQALPLVALHSIVQVVIRFKHADQIYPPEYKITLEYNYGQIKPNDIIKQGQLIGKAIDYHPVTKELRYVTYDKSFSIHTPINGIRPISQSTKITRPKKLINAYLLIDYIYLGQDERSNIMTNTHELLIEQVHQNTTLKSSSPNIKHNMMVKAPVKAIYWLAQLDKSYEYVSCDSQILLSGIVRDQINDSVYYNYVQPYQHHTNSPVLGFHMYSFALIPESTQPSGSANLSKVDTVQLMLKLDNSINSSNTATVRSYAVGYNIFRIALGTSKLMF